MSLSFLTILGIIEGVTEFLPISSTAHLLITKQLLAIPDSSFFTVLLIAIQFSAILSLLLVFPKRLFVEPKLWLRIIVGFIPTGIAGFLLYKIIFAHFVGNFLLMASMLILGGVLFLYIERKDSYEVPIKDPIPLLLSLSYKEWFLFGVVQSLAVIPGVSRSGAIMVYGRLKLLPRVLITEIAFLLAFPTMFTATLYDIYKHHALLSHSDWSGLIFAMVVSFFVAFVSARWLLKFVSNHTFRIFGWYRIILGIFVIFWFF